MKPLLKNNEDMVIPISLRSIIMTMSQPAEIVKVYADFSRKSISRLTSQGDFFRNDNFDFTGFHHAWAWGTGPDDYSMKIESNGDFNKNFKLYFKKVRSQLHGTNDWWTNKYRIDMNNDGTWEQDWTTADEKVVLFTYPNSFPNLIGNHVIRIEIEWTCNTGQVYKRSKYIPINVYPHPRVYVNQENNTFVQLRDEDCTSKIPILLVEGFDPMNDKFPETYYNLTWDLVNTDLYPNGFEVFILNFQNGGEDLTLNAGVLEKALMKIHEICPNFKIGLAGLSMGGPISRYALAKAEDQHRDHKVGLFLSFDSPQDYAHVNPNLQDWIYLQDPSVTTIADLQANLNSTAAKQMLYYNTYDREHNYRDAFYNELNSLNGDGYPHESYNVSVSNGNFVAEPGYGAAGRHLMTLKINNNLYHYIPAEEWDCGTGSKMTDITMRRYGDIFHNPFFRVFYEVEIIFNPAYIPTWSSLDLVDVEEDGFGNIIHYERSMFDDFIVQDEPLEHHELSNITRDKIMDWLDLDFNIQIIYNMINGGSLNPDNYLVNILHGVPVQIQPANLNINGRLVNYNFLNWWDDNTNNPRKLFSSHNVTRQCSMKGHRVANTSGAISNNSQRKILFDGSDYHLVYEDQGEIYYTTSNDGEVWLPEKRVSEGDGGNKTPVIALDPTENICVVWHHVEDSYYNYIQVRTKYEQWDDVQEFQIYYWQSFSATPVIEYVNNNFQIVYKGGFEGDFNLKIRSFNVSNQTFGEETTISNTNSSSVNPSIATNESPIRIHLAWEESGKIYYSCLNSLYQSIINRECVSDGSGHYNHRNPCITTTHTKFPNVMWQSWLTAGWDIVLHRQRRMTYPEGWGSCTAFINEEESYLKPSATGFKEINNNIKAAWGATEMEQYNSSLGIRVANYNESSWEVNSIADYNAFEPNLAVNNTLPYDDCILVYRKYTSNPYFIETSSQYLSEGFEEKTLSKITNSMEMDHHRIGAISIGQNEIAFELGGIEADGSKIRFVSVSDSVIIGKNSTLDQAFRTNSFQISDRSSLKFSFGSRIIGQEDLLASVPKGEDIVFSINLINAQTGKVLYNFDKWAALKNLPSDTLITKTYTFNMKGSQNVFLGINLDITSGIIMKES